MANTKLTSPVTGTVWKILAKPGDALAAGADVLLVESMKMEIPVSMPHAGRIKAVHVKEEDSISEGQLLAEIE